MQRKREVGELPPRENLQGAVEQEGEPTPYQYTRTYCGRTSNKNIYERVEGKINTHSNRQHNSSFIPDKNGGHKKYRNDNNSKTNLDILAVQRDHTYCRMDSEFRELHCGLGIQEHQRFQRMEVMSQDFPTPESKTRRNSSRSFCIKDIPSTSSLCKLETRSPLSIHGCLPENMGKSHPVLCVPTFLSDFKSPKKGKHKQSLENDTYYTSLDNPTLVPIRTEYVHTKPTTSSNIPKSPCKSTRGMPSTDREIKSSTSGMDNLRNSLLEEGISKEASDLISNARREGTRTNYECAWKKWSKWCSRRDADPIKCPLNLILDFLSELFKEKLAYRTIGVTRSAISAFHVPIDGMSVGKHPRVSSLMKGVANLRPLKPKYCEIWDVEDVLNQIRTWPTNSILSIKLLTLKTAMLLALIAIPRGSELHLFDTSLMTKSKEKYIFYLRGTVKHSTDGKTPPEVDFHSFIEEPCLCPVLALEEYTKRMKEWKSASDSKLFRSILKPHREVTKSTITRWIKEVLKMSGIDITVFQTHSIRAAASSKAHTMGLSTDDVLKKGNWSQESTWQKFYHKNIISASKNFQVKVLSKALNKADG